MFRLCCRGAGLRDTSDSTNLLPLCLNAHGVLRLPLLRMHERLSRGAVLPGPVQHQPDVHVSRVLTALSLRASALIKVETTSEKRGLQISPNAVPFLFMYSISLTLTIRVDRPGRDRNAALLRVPLHSRPAIVVMSGRRGVGAR